jgi:hypothetical protein
MRLVIVIRAAFAEQANELIGQHIPGGEHTFTVPLYDSNGVIRAYWCNWDFAATGHDPESLITRFVSAMGFTVDDVAVRSNTTGADLSTRKMAVFNEEFVSPQQFLDFAGLQTSIEEV